MSTCSVILCVFIILLIPYPGLGMTGGSYFIIAFPQFVEYKTSVVFLQLTKAATGTNKLTVSVEFDQDVKKCEVKSMELVSLRPSITFPRVGYGKSVIVTSEGGEINVTVVVKLTNPGFALFKAIPVSSWGTVYGAVILWYNPVIQIVASSNCYVKLFIFSNDVKFSITFEGKKYGPNSTMDAMMNRLESFTLSGHTNISKFVDQISGTNISSSAPIGIISGSSPETVLDPECLSVSLSTYEDMALEMLPPVEHYHSYFITADFKMLTRHNYLIVMAAENATAVSIKEGDRTRNVHVDLALFPYKVNVAASVLVTSTKPITVVNVLSSGCLDGDVYHGPSMSVVVPFSFLYAAYSFVAPSFNRSTQAYIQVIHSNLNLSELVYDDGELGSDMTWEVHPAEVKFSVGTMSITVNERHVIHDSAGTTFWCTVFGYTKHDSYMLFAGYAGPDIVHDVTATTPPRRQETRPACTFTPMKPGDRIDNDCDDRRDEEKMNGEDDDLDGRKDEDLERDPHEECERGHFGKKCDKLCHCAWSCDKKGNCVGDNVKCASGFFGTSCNYVDLAEKARIDYDLLIDNNDTTCHYFNLSSQSINIEFPTPKVFSMMRIILQTSVHRDFKVFFKETASAKYFFCPSKYQTNNIIAGDVEQFVDIYCKLNHPVISLQLKANGDATLCTINISGGGLKLPSCLVEFNSATQSGGPQTGVVNGPSNNCPQIGVVLGSSTNCLQTSVVHGSSNNCPQTGVVNGQSTNCPQTGVVHGPSNNCPQKLFGRDIKSND